VKENVGIVTNPRGACDEPPLEILHVSLVRQACHAEGINRVSHHIGRASQGIPVHYPLLVLTASNLLPTSEASTRDTTLAPRGGPVVKVKHPYHDGQIVPALKSVLTPELSKKRKVFVTPKYSEGVSYVV